MKPNDHPNPADMMNEKLVGYIYEPNESDDIVLVFEKHLIQIPFDTLVIRKRD